MRLEIQVALQGVLYEIDEIDPNHPIALILSGFTSGTKCQGCAQGEVDPPALGKIKLEPKKYNCKQPTPKHHHQPQIQASKVPDCRETRSIPSNGPAGDRRSLECHRVTNSLVRPFDASSTVSGRATFNRQ